MAELFRKKANAKIRGAEGRGPALGITEGLDTLMGGTWVGGEVVLTDRVLGFRANKVNKLMQRGDLDVEFELSDVRGAAISGGVATKIIQVELTDGSRFLFRCFGARDALAALLAALPDHSDSGGS